jgi:hypothetical protein
MHTTFRSEHQKGMHYFEDPGVDEKIILKLIQSVSVWIGFIWFVVGSSDGLL